MNNAQAMLNMYIRANPNLTRREAFDLMLKNERHFFGLDIKLKPNKKRKKRK